tara:strand:- start:132 stop:518 length:387 start_codon:yes stop_codon:yes gene_type:complete
MNIIDLFGRILISLLFLVEGVKKIFNPEMSMMYMSKHNVPEILFYPSVAFELIVPAILIIGYKTKLAASILAAFVLVVTLIFHAPFIFSNGMQLLATLKNLSIAGGLFIIISNQPKFYTLDHYFKNKK